LSSGADLPPIRFQPGIGTFAKVGRASFASTCRLPICLQPGILTPILLWFARMVDMAIAWYLDEHVLGGYMFLMQNYEPGGVYNALPSYV